uniref:Uncharacterized protein n=1 Tax=Strigamia maritima TaxID=126957 RepID=T1IV93_STRMM
MPDVVGQWEEGLVKSETSVTLMNYSWDIQAPRIIIYFQDLYKAGKL